MSAPAQAAPPKPPRAESPTKHQVTLITGDRVLLDDGGRGLAVVEPGPGRRQIAFNTYRVRERLYVVPSDVQPDVASGRLDQRLFDVNGLIAAQYDDKSSPSIPVIVTYAGRAKQRAVLPGAKVARQLPSVNGTALQVRKTDAGSFLAGVGKARSAGAVAKVWLDGKRKPSLDLSVPKIGAPEAWKAGFTGQGVKVAVLDTGIDKTHPDLATQVAGTQNFTDEPGADKVGHGTHVASTIAGTGAASGGKYKGVAPDAKLYDGKVCVVEGCPDSAILAGMEWAAKEVKADVVNLSLGGPDTPEIDPLEAAVNRLSAETGALFVIAAGNSGPTNGTVESPGSADAALTVGALDEFDQLAEFSSRGPRIGDAAVKPDLIAPGDGIIAAKAKDAIIGRPVGDQYLVLSGTSMATPHAAGAAALLRQQHPAWQSAELKSALTGTAKATDGQTAFQEGAGLVDVAKAIKQNVVTEPGALSFGTASWPHDDDQPVTKPLTYRNLGDQPVTLNLATDLKGPDGNPAPSSAIALSANQVSVPAGGTATVQVTSDTKHDGPDGLYSGRVTATAAGLTLTSPIGIDREVEKYVLTLRGVGPDGEPVAPRGMLYEIADDQLHFYGTGKSEVKLRLPKGEHILDNRLIVPDPNNPAKSSNYWTAQPSLQLTEDTTIVIDARAAKPLEVSVPNQEAELATAVLGYERPLPDYKLWAPAAILPGIDSFYTLHLGPELPTDQLFSFLSTQWAKPDASGGFDNSPFSYAQFHSDYGRFPTGVTRKLRQQDFATIEQQVNAVSDRTIWRSVNALTPGRLSLWTRAFSNSQPSSAKVFVEAKAAHWSTSIIEPMDLSQDPHGLPFGWHSWIDSPYKVYQPGKTYRERFNAAAFGTGPSEPMWSGDLMLLFLDPLVDADGNRGNMLVDSESGKLFRNGELVYEVDRFGFVVMDGLPKEPTRYVYETTQSRPSHSALSTRTDLRFEFTSAPGDGEKRIPMVGVGYRPKVDQRNRVDRTPVTVLPVFLTASRDVNGVEQPLPKIKKVEVQVSGDGGKTWRAAKVSGSKGEYRAVFATPKGAQDISLRVHVADAEGNTTDQTTIGAYPLK
nr:S8 family serine peptidase [Kribbella sandramycini]